MKKLLIIMISIGLALGASAQKVIRGGGHYAPRPRVSVGIGLGYGYGYSPFYSPYYGFGSPFYYPPYGYNNGYRRPSRLDMEIQDIKTDYADQIKSLRMDNSLSGHERRQQIRELKTERDKAITEAQRNYYYKRSAPRQQQNNNHGNNGNGTNNSNGSNNSNNNNDDSSGN